MTLPAGWVRCLVDDECGVIGVRPTVRERAQLLNQHYDQVHLGLQSAIVQLPSVDWHAQAMTAIRALAVSGRPFVISEVINVGVPDAPNPRTDWANVTNEAQALGWIEPTNRLGHSVRPKTKGSPVTEWVGTAKAREVSAA